MPLTAETFEDYQECEHGGLRMLGYMDATYHLLTVLRKIEKATSFTAMKKQITAFRKDREKFQDSVNGTFNGQKFQGRKPE